MKPKKVDRELNKLMMMRATGDTTPTRVAYWLGQVSPDLMAEYLSELREVGDRYIAQSIEVLEKRSGKTLRSTRERDIEEAAREFAREEEMRDRRDAARRAGRLIRPALRGVAKLHVDGDSADFSWEKPLKK